MPEQIRLTEIDATNIDVHVRLLPTDTCYFLYEYTSHRNYAFSSTNNLISNLKKKPSERHRPGYQYKARAIRDCAADLKAAINPDWLVEATLVPIPGSKAADHPDFDDRVERICRGLGPKVDVRPLVRQTATTVASHEVSPGNRPSVADLLAAYEINEAASAPPPKQIGIIDDVLTNGTHFRAMSTILHNRFPNVPITGLFVARRVFPEEEAASGFDDLDF